MSNKKVIYLNSGLGNQMFQYAFGKALEIKTGANVFFDISWFKQGDRDFKLNIFKNIKLKIADEEQIARIRKECRPNKLIRFIKKILHYKNIEPQIYFEAYGKNGAFKYFPECFTNKYYTFYSSCFQNEQYIENLRDGLLNDFTFPELKQNSTAKELADKITNCQNPVFIHVRQGDYAHFLDRGFHILTPEYYNKAISIINNKVKNPTFFIFGQNIENWVKENFTLDNDNFILVGDKLTRNGDDYLDMQLMSMCKHGIIANSTFSWWAAYLIKNNDKIITAPSPWLHDSDEIICKNWTKINWNPQTLVGVERE